LRLLLPLWRLRNPLFCPIRITTKGGIPAKEEFFMESRFIFIDGNFLQAIVVSHSEGCA